MKWNKGDNAGTSANSLFKGRCRRGFLSSPFTSATVQIPDHLPRTQTSLSSSMIMYPSHGPLQFITSHPPLGCPITLHQSVAQNLSDMCRSTLEIGAAQLRSAAEIAPKSPFLCVNRIWYGFLAGAKAIRCLIPLLVWEQVYFLLPIHYTDLFFQCNTQLDCKTVGFFFLKIGLAQLKSLTRAKRRASHACN